MENDNNIMGQLLKDAYIEMHGASCIIKNVDVEN